MDWMTCRIGLGSDAWKNKSKMVDWTLEDVMLRLSRRLTS
jgi:hypothetical protein